MDPQLPTQQPGYAASFIKLLVLPWLVGTQISEDLKSDKSIRLRRRRRKLNASMSLVLSIYCGQHLSPLCQGSPTPIKTRPCFCWCVCVCLQISPKSGRLINILIVATVQINRRIRIRRSILFCPEDSRSRTAARHSVYYIFTHWCCNSNRARIT